MLDALAEEAVLQGVAPSTARKYAYTQRGFVDFCRSLGMDPVPCSKQAALRYMMWLKNYKRLGADTIRGHFAAIRHLHAINGESFQVFEDPRLGLAKKASCRRSQVKDRRIPVRYATLASLYAAASTGTSYEDLLFLTAALVMYTGFFRISEVCGKTGTPSRAGIRMKHLSVADGSLVVLLEQSKTDALGEGATVHIKALQGNPCPVQLLKGYLLVRPSTDSEKLVFLHENGAPMSAAWFRQRLKKKCEENGISGKVNTHSLRMGAASDASARGVASHTIKALGRWRSNSFEIYIRPSGSALAGTVSIFAST
jgi:site-specific recombinase XerC